MTQRRYDYDYFVIGGGSGGVRSARIAAQHGAKVGIAESSQWGGTCVNLGCVPKKLMSYAADLGHAIEDAVNYGWTTDKKTFDWCTLIENKDKEINRLNAIYQKILKQNNVDIFEGYARFVDAHTLEIDGKKTITTDKILIAVGGKPRCLAIPGHEHAIVSDDVFHLPSHPGKTIIYGGGYVAVEFAHILQGMGCNVEIIYHGPMFLRGFDDDLRLVLAQEMKKQNVTLHFETAVEKLSKDDNKTIVHLDNGQTLECDTFFAAVGRIPHTEKLGLDKAGVTTSKNGEIIVDQHFQTNIDNIFAVGDVTSTIKLTPVAIVEGHVLADRLFGSDHVKNRTVNYDHIATAIFSQPPIGTVGLSEEDAVKKGYDVKIFRTTFTPMIHTISKREEKTMMKLIVCRDTNKVLGIHLLGRDTPEIIQGFATALQAGATKADFDATMAIHPTSAEELVTMYQESIPSG